MSSDGAWGVDGLFNRGQLRGRNLSRQIAGASVLFRSVDALLTAFNFTFAWSHVNTDLYRELPVPVIL